MELNEIKPPSGSLADDNLNTVIRSYTSSSGERRIRVHTMAADVTADLGEMYRSADVGAIASIMSRLGMTLVHHHLVS